MGLPNPWFTVAKIITTWPRGPLLMLHGLADPKIQKKTCILYIYIYTCTTWKVDVATPMFWFIITPYKSPSNLGIYFHQQWSFEPPGRSFAFEDTPTFVSKARELNSYPTRLRGTDVRGNPSTQKCWVRLGDMLVPWRLSTFGTHRGMWNPSRGFQW